MPYTGIIGSREGIEKAIKKGGFKWGNNLKNDLIKMIKIEIKINPDRVGLPIDVLCIHPHKFVWLTDNKYK